MMSINWAMVYFLRCSGSSRCEEQAAKMRSTKRMGKVRFMTLGVCCIKDQPKFFLIPQSLLFCRDFTRTLSELHTPWVGTPAVFLKKNQNLEMGIVVPKGLPQWEKRT